MYTKTFWGSIQNRTAAIVLGALVCFGILFMSGQLVHAQSSPSRADLLAQIQQLLQQVRQLQTLKEAQQAGLSVGDRVESTAALKVRSEAGAFSAVRKVVTPKTPGTIVGGPRELDGYTWWRVSYDDDVSGWSAEPWLKPYVTVPAGQSSVAQANRAGNNQSNNNNSNNRSSNNGSPLDSHGTCRYDAEWGYSGDGDGIGRGDQFRVTYAQREVGPRYTWRNTTDGYGICRNNGTIEAITNAEYENGCDAYKKTTVFTDAEDGWGWGRGFEDVFVQVRFAEGTRTEFLYESDGEKVTPSGNNTRFLCEAGDWVEKGPVCESDGREYPRGTKRSAVVVDGVRTSIADGEFVCHATGEWRPSDDSFTACYDNGRYRAEGSTQTEYVNEAGQVFSLEGEQDEYLCTDDGWKRDSTVDWRPERPVTGCYHNGNNRPVGEERQSYVNEDGDRISIIDGTFECKRNGKWEAKGFTACYSDNRYRRLGNERDTIIDEEGIESRIANGRYVCTNDGWQPTIQVEDDTWDGDDVRSVVRLTIDPLPNSTGDEYRRFTITLNNGEVITVNVAPSLTDNQILTRFRNKGFDGGLTQLNNKVLQEAEDAEYVRNAIRINAGGPTVIGTNGNQWLSDRFFLRGSAYDWGDVEIDKADFQDVYRTERSGMDEYRIPVSDGLYNVRLRFAENDPAVTAAGDRVFDVIVEGERIDDIDVFAAVGKNTRYIRNIEVEVTDEVLNIEFESDSLALINGIAVIPKVAE